MKVVYFTRNVTKLEMEQDQNLDCFIPPGFWDTGTF